MISFTALFLTVLLLQLSSGGVGPLDGVVEAPVEAVDVEVHPAAAGSGTAHPEVEVVDELVAESKIRRGLPDGGAELRITCAIDLQALIDRPRAVREGEALDLEDEP